MTEILHQPLALGNSATTYSDPMIQYYQLQALLIEAIFKNTSHADKTEFTSVSNVIPFLQYLVSMYCNTNTILKVIRINLG